MTLVTIAETKNSSKMLKVKVRLDAICQFSVVISYEFVIAELITIRKPFVSRMCICRLISLNTEFNSSCVLIVLSLNGIEEGGDRGWWPFPLS